MDLCYVYELVFSMALWDFYSLSYFAADSVGFGIRRRSGSYFYPALLREIPFEKSHPINFCFGFRGIHAALKFTFHGAALLHPSPRPKIRLSLQNAARYALHQLLRTSVVRRSASLACKASTSDFARAIQATHLMGAYVCATPENVFRYQADPEAFTSMLFCLTKTVSNLYGPMAITPLESIQTWWTQAQDETLQQKLQRAGELRWLLEPIERHSLPNLARELLRFIFYFTLTFDEDL